MTMQQGLRIIFETQLSHKTGMVISDFRLRIKTWADNNKRFAKAKIETLELGPKEKATRLVFSMTKAGGWRGRDKF
jgi:hypothetical protein